MKALSVAPRAHKLGRKVVVTKTGMEMAEGLELEDWLELGKRISEAHGAASWALADWLAFGGHEYGVLSNEACAITGLAPKTHWNLASVADAVEPSRRREDLSFAHHVEVASLDPEAQATWLTRAAAEGMNRDELREAIRETRALASGNGQPTLARIHFAAPPERAERWKAAAEEAGKDFAEWATEVLDAAAA